jgi:hypothetical protein
MERVIIEKKKAGMDFERLFPISPPPKGYESSNQSSKLYQRARGSQQARDWQ